VPSVSCRWIALLLDQHGAVSRPLSGQKIDSRFLFALDDRQLIALRRDRPQQRR